MDTAYETSQKIQAFLSPGESLLWSGRPKQGLTLTGSDAFLIPFSLLWCAFAVFWEYTAYTQGAPLFFLLFGGVFVVAGIYFVIGRFFVDSMIRGKTYYAVTDERVLIHSEFPTTKTKSLSLDTISDVTLTTKGGGFGSISFGPQHPMAAMFGGIQWPGMSAFQGPSFESIGDVATVFETIQSARRKSRGAT